MIQYPSFIYTKIQPYIFPMLGLRFFARYRNWETRLYCLSPKIYSTLMRCLLKIYITILLYAKDTFWFISRILILERRNKPQREKMSRNATFSHVRPTMTQFSLCILSYHKGSQWKFWSDCANAQAELNFCWAHISESTFPDVSAYISSEGKS